MNSDEVIDLLTTAAAFDRRTVGEADVIAWQSAVGDLDFPDARDAVVQHYRNTRDWIMPSDVRRLVKAIRDARLTLAPVPAPPAELADRPRDYRTALKAALAKMARGWPAPPRQITAKVEPSTEYVQIRGADHDPVRIVAIRVTCPWPPCKALPGVVCVDADGNRLSAPAHEARLKAAGLAEIEGAP